MNRLHVALVVLTLAVVAFRPGSRALGQERRPNILWIVADDMSPHFGVYGETTIETPTVDRLAREGVLFENAFVTAPVCSPSRSALITGLYQTTLGAHNHRSQGAEGKRGGNEDYYESYEVPEGIKLVPERFREAGYYTVLGGPMGSGDLAKADYNFIWDPGVAYSGSDWSGRRPGQPFFAQIQLRGGKLRLQGGKTINVDVSDPVDPDSVHLPPYYPDTPVLREDWAQYLNAVKKTDRQVGEILDRLDEEGLADNTIVFFFADHGISHIRGKQFLYDEGIHVPLIIRWPGHLEAGMRRSDLVSHIDVTATSLALAGLPVPEYMQGRPLFSDGYTPRRFVYAARDRMDETVDVVRAIRTKRYKYIRNYYTHRSHVQPNQYKDRKEIMQVMRRLYREGKLDSTAASMFTPVRPAEELYDLKEDPYEMRSVAGDPAYRDVLQRMRRWLTGAMARTRDMGLIPEPILEDLGRRYGSKYAAMKREEVRAQIPRIQEVIWWSEDGDAPALVEAMEDPYPSVRYWAAIGLGNLGRISEAAASALTEAMQDVSATVRVAAALALLKHGRGEEALAVLVDELENRNLLVRLYAILALEEIGEKMRPALERLKAKREGEYEYVRRVARRLTRKMEGVVDPLVDPTRAPTPHARDGKAGRSGMQR